MARLKFGAFLAPHHPIGENPLLQFRRDLDFVEQIDSVSTSSGAASTIPRAGK
jgi:limonene 1,2-monooxygenase